MYKTKLDRLYQQVRQNHGSPPGNKLQFLGDTIFDFTTYDSDIDEVLATRMIEVLDAILNRYTHEYQKDESKYLNYLIMVNMPFLVDKLNWGTSIRGAWLDSGRRNDYIIHTGFTMDGSDKLSVPAADIEIFAKELIEWSKQEEAIDEKL